MRVPRNAGGLQALSIEDLGELVSQLQLKLSHFRHRRGGGLMVELHDNGALTVADAQIKATGNLLGVVLARRGQLRTQHRKALRQMPRRDDATAMAVDTQLSVQTWEGVQAEADRILSTAAMDLAEGSAPAAPDNDQSNQPPPPVRP
jgi:hypothetical protein